MDFKAMREKWESAVVARDKVGKFSGGLLHPRTMSNLDAKGKGPKRFRMGNRKVGYFVDDLIAWMMQRMEVVA